MLQTVILPIFQLADYQIVTHAMVKPLIFRQLKYSCKIWWHSPKKKLTLRKSLMRP